MLAETGLPGNGVMDGPLAIMVRSAYPDSEPGGPRYGQLMNKEQLKEAVHASSPSFSGEMIAMHFTGMPAAYFEQFDPAAICDHLLLLAALNDNRKAAVSATQIKDHCWDLIVVAHDHQGVLSCLTCLFATHGFNIKNAEIHSYRAGIVPEGRIVDVFRVEIARPDLDVSEQTFVQIEQTFADAMGYLEQGRLLDALQSAGGRKEK